jgi:hypothetical protein
MASSIKVRESTKLKLEKLQALLLLNYGKKISQQDLIDILLNLAEKDPMSLIKKEYISSEKIDRIFKLAKPWKIDTEPDMLDEIIVGED